MNGKTTKQVLRVSRPLLFQVLIIIQNTLSRPFILIFLSSWPSTFSFEDHRWVPAAPCPCVSYERSKYVYCSDRFFYFRRLLILALKTLTTLLSPFYEISCMLHTCRPRFVQENWHFMSEICNVGPHRAGSSRRVSNNRTKILNVP